LSNDVHPVDIEFALSRTPYYVDNNGHPTVGGRLGLTQKLGELLDFTLGERHVRHLDRATNSRHAIFGWGPRVSNLRRACAYPARTKYGNRYGRRGVVRAPLRTSSAVMKQGALCRARGAAGLFGGFWTRGRALSHGNVLLDPAEDDTPLSFRELGPSLHARREQGARARVSDEAIDGVWQFSDEDDVRAMTRVGMHLAFVGTY
jgi:hypothetical protein